jgi:hypothetical protein
MGGAILAAGARKREANRSGRPAGAMLDAWPVAVGPMCRLLT